MNPRAEAQARVGDRFDVRVLEPSPPAVTAEPFADDPVATEPRATGAPVLSPIPNGDRTWDDLAAAEPDLAEFCSARWLGAWRPLEPIIDLERYVQTRLSWHALAEHVLAPARHAVNAKIGLRFTHGGFGTPFFGTDRQVLVHGDRLTVVRDGVETDAPVTTLAAAGAAIGVTPGAPTEVFTPTTDGDPEAMLAIDAVAAQRLGDWFGFACSLLETVRAEATAPSDSPSLVQLWPEHFDLGADLGDESGGHRGTFGASPGDVAHPEPYLYVTHWSDVPSDPFWNATAFPGAIRSYSELVAAPDARAVGLGFLRAGRAALGGG